LRRIFKTCAYLICGAAALIVLCLTLYAALDALFPLPVEKLYPAASVTALDNKGRLLRAWTSPDGKWRIRRRLNEISPRLRDLLIAYEDRWFYRHPGINPLAVLRALKQNITSGEIVSGASTISMQTARMIEDRPRLISSKLIEAFRTIQIERRFSKDEILEIYFNMAPYGGNIEGVGAAALFYFGRDARELTLGQAALLAAIPNSPTRTRPDRHPEAARRARARLLNILLKRSVITRAELDQAVAEPVESGRKRLPFIAPHASEMLRVRRPHDERISSTIDSDIQRLVDAVAAAHGRELRRRGVTQMSLVVLDNSSGAVIALSGSLDFFDEHWHGQVNGAMAPRSPGSTLKPFIYGLAIDAGLLTPGSMLVDAPVRYGNYDPENYDGNYRGLVTMREALETSLNVPAVNVLSLLGRNGLYPFLKSAGVTTLDKPESAYGLSMALGGCEMKLLELSGLYMMLARSGVYVTPHILAEDAPASKRLLSEEAAYIVTDMLTGLRRPDFPRSWQYAADLPRVAWKTGTSYGHRDAWSVGYNPHFTVGVWAGNFEGRGAAELVGSEVAAPLLFDIFKVLPRSSEAAWFKKPTGVEEREVCALSGMPPGPHCGATRHDLFIPNVSSSKSCNMHRAYDIDNASGYRLCSRCRTGHAYGSVVYEIYPPQAAEWMAANGYAVKSVPRHNPACQAVQSGAAPQINSPQDGLEYLIRHVQPLDHQKIKLSASPASEGGLLYWFVDGVLTGQVEAGRDLYWLPSQGRHVIVCADEEGRRSQVEINIK